VNSSIAAGELPAALLVGYQNDQSFYQLNDVLVDLNTLIERPDVGAERGGARLTSTRPSWSRASTRSSTTSAWASRRTARWK
jgi:hypothetical protein